MRDFFSLKSALLSRAILWLLYPHSRRYFVSLQTLDPLVFFTLYNAHFFFLN